MRFSTLENYIFLLERSLTTVHSIAMVCLLKLSVNFHDWITWLSIKCHHWYKGIIMALFQHSRTLWTCVLGPGWSWISLIIYVMVPYIVQCCYNAFNFLTNIHKKDPIACPLACDWYSASVPVIIYVISYNIAPHYNGTRLYRLWFALSSICWHFSFVISYIFAIIQYLTISSV